MMNVLPRARKRLSFELRAFLRCFYRHEHNNDHEKYLTWAAFIVWGVIAVGIAFGYADATPTFDQLTMVVVAMLFQLLGYERGTARQQRRGNGGEN